MTRANTIPGRRSTIPPPSSPSNGVAVSSRLFASIDGRDVVRARDSRPARRDVAVERTFVLFDAFRFIRRRADGDGGDDDDEDDDDDGDARGRVSRRSREAEAEARERERER